MAFYDTELRYVHVNRCLADANGVPVEAHRGRTTSEVVPDFPADLLAEYQTVLAGGEAVLNRVTGVGRGGSTWQLNLFPVRRGPTEVIGLGIIAQDVTQRVHSEKRLRESEARYRGLTQAIPQMVYVANGAGEIIYFNNRWIEFTGLTIERCRADGWDEAIHPDDLPAVIASWRGSSSKARTCIARSFAYAASWMVPSAGFSPRRYRYAAMKG